EREWAETLLRQALDRLAEECALAGKDELFKQLNSHLSVSSEAAVPYEEMSLRLGRPITTLRSDVARLRSRYRAILREEVGGTVAEASSNPTRSRQIMQRPRLRENPPSNRVPHSGQTAAALVACACILCQELFKARVATKWIPLRVQTQLVIPVLSFSSRKLLEGAQCGVALAGMDQKVRHRPFIWLIFRACGFRQRGILPAHHRVSLGHV